jgi:branched-chain amino acid transport system substrate-binding protein
MTRSGRGLVLLALLALVGCAGRSEQPVLVGHVAAQSGPDKEAGEAAARGIRLAVMEANKDPDKGAGRQVKVSHTDTQGKLDAYEAEAVRLATVNRVAALLGGNTLEEVERLELARVPVVSPCGTRGRAMGEGVFCTGLMPAFQGKVLARFAVEELKAARVSVVVDERREEALQLADAFVRAFPELAAKKDPKAPAARPVPIRFGKDARFAELAKRLKGEEKAQLLLFAGGVEDLRALRAELGEPALPVLFGGEDGSFKALLANRETGDAVYLTTAFVADADTPRAQEFVKKYRETFSEDADVYAALAYDNARLLFEALRRAGAALSGAKLVEELAGLKDFPGLTGSVSFGEDRRLRRPAFVVGLEKRQAKTLKRYAAED